MKIRGYQTDVQRLGRDLGGGFVAFAPELSGCIGDGRTRLEALRDLEDSILCWLEIAAVLGRTIPRALGPGTGKVAPNGPDSRSTASAQPPV